MDYRDNPDYSNKGSQCCTPIGGQHPAPVDTRQQIAAGIDPSAEKRRARVMAQIAAGSPFRGVAEEWVAKQKREGLAEITIEKIEWLLDMAYRTLASRPINDIDALEVLTALRRVKANARYESAKRTGLDGLAVTGLDQFSRYVNG